MRFIFGLIFVFICVFGGYMAMGGKMGALNQPFEFVIIAGGAFGAFIIANNGSVMKDTGKALKFMMRGGPYKKADYLELLCMLFHVFKLARSKGMLELEAHIENPSESAILKKYPNFMKDHYVVDFFCDYMRLLTMGIDNHHVLDDLMREELEIIKHEKMEPGHAMDNMSQGMPAIGIVAAVLGVIKTMGAITEPPEVLGKLIGGALVGTFLGVFLSYCIVGPMAAFMTSYASHQMKYYEVIKMAILMHIQGNPPQVTIEFARKLIPQHDMPSFREVEDACAQVEVG